jgi:hypothetical protein
MKHFRSVVCWRCGPAETTAFRFLHAPFRRSA